MAVDQRFPLSWPAGWRRVSPGSRGRARFRAGAGGARLSIGAALGRLLPELRRLGAGRVVISSNLHLKSNGIPYADQRKVLDDPGVAVYFTLRGAARVLACDRWNSAADNLAAIAGHIEAIRSIDRYGVGSIDQAFAGYTALPSQAASWFTVLEFDGPPAAWDLIEARYKSLARVHHPDVGGKSETMAKINAAYDTARLEFGRR